MANTKSFISVRRLLTHIGIAVGSVSAAFLFGMQSAGEVQPISLIRAGGTDIAGDLNGNGVLDAEDAIAALEIARGYRAPSRTELEADPNGDFRLTVDDAIAILRGIDR